MLTDVRKIFSTIVVMIITASPAAAARTPILKFTDKTDLPSLGIKLKLMPDSRAVPIPPPTTYTYTFSSGKESYKKDMYSPRELWVISQSEGTWTDEYNNTLTIAKISLPRPEGFSRDHVDMDEYEGKVALLKAGAPKWTIQTITQWVMDFTEAEKAVPAMVKRKPMGMTSLASFLLTGKEKNSTAYVFRIKRASSRRIETDATWYFVKFDINPQIDITKARSVIESSFFPSVSASITAPDRSVGSKPDTLKRPAGKSREFMESRKFVVQSIQNMNDWWYAETKNYIFLSNLKSRYRVMVNDLQENIEHLRSAYELFIPPVAEIKAVSVIRVFASSEEYLAFVGEQYSWSGGLWMADKKELIIRPIDSGGSKDQRDVVFKTVYHEAFHQYIYYALDQVMPSVWFNEGHAVFFGESKIKNNKLQVEEDERRFKILEGMFKDNRVNITEMLTMSYEDFYTSNRKKLEENYTLAWAIVYYLRKGAPLDRKSKAAGIPHLYLKALSESGDPEKATLTAFNVIGIREFENNFKNFWNSRNMRGAAKRNRIFSRYGIKK